MENYWGILTFCESPATKEKIRTQRIAKIYRTIEIQEAKLLLE